MTRRDRHGRARSLLLALGAALLAALTLLPTATALPSATPARSGFYVVRFEQRITDPARHALTATGARIIDYEPVDSYIVWATQTQATRASKLATVESVAPLPLTRKFDALAPVDLSYAQVTVYAPTLRSATRILGQLGSIHKASIARADGLLATVTATLPPTALEQVLHHPAVLYVSSASRGLFPEDEMGDQIVAGNIEPDTNRPFPGYGKWLDKVELGGKGIVVSIIDTGISDQHPDVGPKIAETYDYSKVAEPVDSGGHGTHVAGIVGGQPSEPTDFDDREGFTYGVGVAPKVKFIDQNAIGTTAEDLPLSEPKRFERYTSDAWKAGARMWNASWHTGEGQRVGYLASVRAFDELARDAVFETKRNDEFLFVFSAGNAGRSGPTVPKEAKNIIAVGATNSGRGQLPSTTTDIDEVASFSSRGPTKDGRIFPTVSAPGRFVMSARAPEGAITATCVPPPDGAGLYANCSGTSMAAPHVTGASALIHQWWKRRWAEVPSPAMVRALLVNTATDIGDANIPNMDEGWGRVNLGELFANRGSLYLDQKRTFGAPGEDASYEIDVRATDGPLKITLTWNDAPAAVGAERVLVNDLDLSVRLLDPEGGVAREWLGNVFIKGQSVAGGKRDDLNNTENVYLLAPQQGRYRITVSATNVPGDGVPNNGDATDQDFALVARWGRAR